MHARYIDSLGVDHSHGQLTDLENTIKRLGFIQGSART